MNDDDGEKGELRTLLEAYVRSKSVTSLFELLDMLDHRAMSADIIYVRRNLWTFKTLTLPSCARVDKSLPPVFGRVFSNLRNLDLSNNGLEKIPIAIVECAQLQELMLQRNCIQTVDVPIGKLGNLQSLDLSDNQISVLPWNLAELHKIENLNISRNLLFTMLLQPDVCERRRAFEKQAERMKVSETDWEEVEDPTKGSKVFYNKKTGHATNTKISVPCTEPNEMDFTNGIEWEIQNMHGNHNEGFYNHSTRTLISTVPDCLDKIGHLFQLVTLRVPGNQLRRLPEGIRKLSFLEEFDASENEITNLLPLENLPRLVKLNLSKNRVTRVARLSSSLQYLDISQNCLEIFPESIICMKAISYLDLCFNNIKRVPYELGFLGVRSLNLTHNPIMDPPFTCSLNQTEKVLWECKQLSKQFDMEGDPTVPLHVSGIASQRSSLLPYIEPRLLQMIDEASCSNDGLDLQNMNICFVPLQVFHTPTIQRIDLSKNPLVNLGKCWAEPMNHLRQVVLRSCKLYELSQSIQNVMYLEHLCLEGNKLTVLPNEVTSLRHLRCLDVSYNRLTVLPHDIGNLTKLVKLIANSNRLKDLPASVRGCKELELISASHNVLAQINECLPSLKSLRELNLDRNAITEIPSELGGLYLNKLSLAFNQIDDLYENCLCPTLQDLNLHGNKIKILPNSFCLLKKLRMLNIDMNPLESPPLFLIHEGIEALVNYCCARGKIVVDLTSKLSGFGFEIEVDNLKPPVTNVLVGGKGYLSSNDLVEFDSLVDGRINGQFYLQPVPIGDIVLHIKKLRDSRQRETHKMIVDSVIDTIKHTLSSPQSETWWIRSDLNVSFNILEGKVPCYSLPLSHVLLPEAGKSGPPWCIFANVNQQVSDLLLDKDLSFDNKALLSALEYSSPFGPVSLMKNVAFICQGEENEMESLIIRQIVYSDEEADRMAREETLLNMFFQRMVEQVKLWTNNRSGMRSVNAEVSHRIRETSRKRLDKKKELDVIRSNSSDKMRVMQSFHQLADNEDDTNEIFAKMKETKAAMDDKLEMVESEYAELLTKQKLKRIEVTKNAIADLQKKYCFLVQQKVLRNGRVYALSMNLRRPWEESFREFKRHFQDSFVVLSPDILTNQLERTLDFAHFAWNNMESMSKYDNAPYTQFLQKSTSVVSGTAGLVKIQ